MTLTAHSHKQQIKARELTGFQLEMRSDCFLIFASSLSCVRVFAFNTRNLVCLQWNLGKHRLGGHAEIAVRVAGTDVSFIAEEHLYFIPGNLRSHRGIVG